MRVFALACAIACLAGCASQPRSPAVHAAVPVASTTQEAALAPAAAPAAKKPSAPPGYKAVERNGTTLYCAKVASLGTKFKQEVCMTQDEYDEVQRRGESVRQDLRNSTKICAGGTGPSSCSGG